MKPTTFFGCVVLASALCSCGGKSKNDSADKTVISDLGLKQGTPVACGPPDQEFGTVRGERLKNRVTWKKQNCIKGNC